MADAPPYAAHRMLLTLTTMAVKHPRAGNHMPAVLARTRPKTEIERPIDSGDRASQFTILNGALLLRAEY